MLITVPLLLVYTVIGENKNMLFKIDTLVFSKCLMVQNGIWKVCKSSIEVKQYCVFTWQQNDGDSQPSVGCESGPFLLCFSPLTLICIIISHFVWPSSACHFISRQPWSWPTPADRWLSMSLTLSASSSSPTSLTQIYTSYTVELHPAQRRVSLFSYCSCCMWFSFET